MAKKKTPKRKSVTKKKTKTAAPGKTKKASTAKPSANRNGPVKKSASKNRAPKASPTGGVARRSTTKSRKASVSGTKRVGKAAVAAEVPVEAPTVQQLRKVKTGLSKRDLGRFRQLLLDKRRETLGDVEAMEVDARMKNAGGNLSNMPFHMADVGSDNYEQEFTLGLVESERRLLREIDDALHRIDEGIYGVCLERGVPIGRPRLEAKPWAKYCIEVARERERQGRY